MPSRRSAHRLRRRRGRRTRRRPRRRHAILPVALAAGVAVTIAIGATGASTSGARATAAAATSGAGTPALLAAAERYHPDHTAFTRRHGGVVRLLDRGRSFVVILPPARRPATVLVTLHGFMSTAFDEFRQWYALAAARGWGIIAPQWRRGLGKGVPVYAPRTIYGAVRRIARRLGVTEGHAVLHGFSTGGVRTYALTALDRAHDRLFGVTIADAGSVSPGRVRSAGVRTSSAPFSGSRWVFFCNGRDPHPTYSGCPAIRRSARYVKDHGGDVERLLVDPRGGHLGFYVHRANMRRTLGVVDRLLG